MRGMVLAAGLGTRLRPLTGDRPKALVEVGGRTMLELALERLKRFGVREAIVNTHHYAEMIDEYLRANDNFGMRIEISREDMLLDTGGGLKKAAWFFLEEHDKAGGAEGGSAQVSVARGGGLQSGALGGPDEPLLAHNVDVLSTIDLAAMVRAHRESGALATLAVQERVTSRYLLFDRDGLLVGRRKGTDGEPEWAGPDYSEVDVTALAFCGIHVISPRIFAEMQQDGAFSIVDAYIELARKGERVMAFRADGSDWRDLGRPESVARAAEEMAAGMYGDR
jgi:NDP-sugar pyrophosphorylase family protein